MAECLGVSRAERWSQIIRVFRFGFTGAYTARSTSKMASDALQWSRALQLSTPLSINETVGVWPFAQICSIMFGQQLTLERMRALEQLNALHMDIVKAMFNSQAAKLPLYRYLPTNINRTVWDFMRGWKQLLKELSVEAESNAAIGGMFADIIRRGEYKHLSEIEVILP